MSSIRLIATDLDFTLLNEHFVLTETTKAGFQHLQLNKSSKYRRNAVFFCQIPLSFTLYMLYNYGGLYLIGR